MIGIDTNLLLRALAHDDDAHGPAARDLLAELRARNEPIFVNHIVLCEFAWVLQRSKKVPRAALATLIETLLTTRLLQLADREAVEEALQLFRGHRLGFADALIGVLNRRAGCTTTYTFDRCAAETGDFSAVE